MVDMGRINDGSLLSSVFIGADEQAYDAAREIWPVFGLPEAEEGEYFHGANVDRIYLNTHGLCVSFVYRRPNPLKQVFSGLFGGDAPAPVFDARKVVDERILQPLLQVELGANCCLEIVPGVQRVGASASDVRELAKDLKGDRLDFYMRREEFVGVLPTPAKDGPHRLIVNRRAVKAMKGYDGAQDGHAGMQENIYGGLRGEFESAFRTASAASVGRVMKECFAISNLHYADPAKILNAHWKQQGPDTERRREIARVADAFQQRLAV